MPIGRALVGEVDSPRGELTRSNNRLAEALLSVTVALGVSFSEEVVAAATPAEVFMVAA